MTAIALTDAQLVTLREFATPIPRPLRAAFLQEVARRLAGHELGDGAVHKAAREAQAKVLNGGRHES